MSVFSSGARRQAPGAASLSRSPACPGLPAQRPGGTGTRKSWVRRADDPSQVARNFAAMAADSPAGTRLPPTMFSLST